MNLEITKGKLTIFLLPLIFAISSCATRSRNALFTNTSDAVIDTLKSVYVFNDKGPDDIYYKIKPEDILAIRNQQNIEFGSIESASGSTPINYIVDIDGTVHLPVIGKVPVAGLTRREATLKIQDLYGRELLKDPIISLTVVNLKVTLLGEFGKQGNYMLEKDNTSLIEVLGIAGGISPRANPKTLKIIRGDRTNPEVIYVNLKDINSLASPKLTLQNNDLVYIEARKIYETTEGARTFTSFVQPAVVLINTALLIYNLSR